MARHKTLANLDRQYMRISNHPRYASHDSHGIVKAYYSARANILMSRSSAGRQRGLGNANG